MTREDMAPETYASLLSSIMDILLENGLKNTTMDSIALKLKISKRTLYEMFSSKSEMVAEVLKSLHQHLSEENRNIAANSSNSMEALLRGFKNYRDVMRKANVNFFRDMDSLFAEARKTCDKSKEAYFENFVTTLRKGRDEGLFRDDMNYTVQCRMIGIQMESLKRMEQLFPPDISLLDVYDNICIGFLRAIATPKGSELLDTLLADISNQELGIRHL